VQDLPAAEMRSRPMTDPSRIPPGTHPNWCRCQGCRNDIARFEAAQFRVVLVLVAIAAVIALIVAAAHAIA
jgi:hypothetical protein